MEIEVGEYVRTKEGKIAKVLEFKKSEEEILNPYELHLDCSDFGICYTKEEIESIKHSKNIIDLIEVGDILNGRLCINIEENYTDTGRRNLELICVGGNILELSNTIQTILTHEQYLQNCYRLEE